MNYINEETLQTLLTGAEGVAKVVSGTTAVLINEAINWYILSGLLAVLKFASVFVIFYIVKRYIDLVEDTLGTATTKAFKTTLLIISLAFFTIKSYPHIENITKAMVAPKLFILEKGQELLQKRESKCQ